MENNQTVEASAVKPKKSVLDYLLKGYSKRERKKSIFAYLILLFPVVQFAIFYVYVNLNSFVLAFQNNETGEFTFKNFMWVFDGFFSEYGMLRTELLRSIITWSIGMFVTFPMSVLFSYALYKRIPAYGVFRVLLYLPGMIGSVVIIMLYSLLVANNGPVVSTLLKLGFELPRELVRDGLLNYGGTAFGTILFYSVWTGVGGNTVVLTGALIRIPDEVFEAAKLDGVSFFREFWNIAIPMIYPTLNTLMIFSLAGIFTADAGTFLFRQDGTGVSTIGYRIFYIVYQISQVGSTAYGEPAALGMVMSVITIPFVLVFRHLLEKHLEAVGY